MKLVWTLIFLAAAQVANANPTCKAGGWWWEHASSGEIVWSGNYTLPIAADPSAPNHWVAQLHETGVQLAMTFSENGEVFNTTTMQTENGTINLGPSTPLKLGELVTEGGSVVPGYNIIHQIERKKPTNPYRRQVFVFEMSCR